MGVATNSVDCSQKIPAHGTGDGKSIEPEKPIVHLMEKYGMSEDDAREVYDVQTGIFARILDGAVKEMKPVKDVQTGLAFPTKPYRLESTELDEEVVQFKMNKSPECKWEFGNQPGASFQICPRCSVYKECLEATRKQRENNLGGKHETSNEVPKVSEPEFSCWNCRSHRRSESRKQRGKYYCLDCFEPTNATGGKREGSETPSISSADGKSIPDYYHHDGNVVVGNVPWPIPRGQKTCPYDLDCQVLTGANAEKLLEILGLDQDEQDENHPNKDLPAGKPTCTCVRGCSLCSGESVLDFPVVHQKHDNCQVHGNPEQDIDPETRWRR